MIVPVSIRNHTSPVFTNWLPSSLMVLYDAKKKETRLSFEVRTNKDGFFSQVSSPNPVKLATAPSQINEAGFVCWQWDKNGPTGQALWVLFFSKASYVFKHLWKSPPKG